MAQNVKTVQGLATASVKTLQGLATASAKTILGVDNSGGQTFLINQTFETPVTGYDNGETWTTGGTGTIDPVYTGVVLQGTQSLRITLSSNQAVAKKTFTAQATVSGFFKFQRRSSSTTADIAFLSDGGDTSRKLVVRTSATSQLTIIHGSVSATTTDAIPINTTVWIWYKYIRGSGSNGFAEVGWSTTSSKPVSGTKYASLNTGDAITTVDRLLLGTNAANETMDSVYDVILISPTDIGDIP